jgi:hypothetical protein
MEKKFDLTNKERRNISLTSDFKRIKEEQPLASRVSIIRELSKKYYIGYHMVSRILKEQGL